MAEFIDEMRVSGLKFVIESSNGPTRIAIDDRLRRK